MTHWRTTLAGTLLAMSTAVTAAMNYHRLQPKHIALIAVLAGAQFLLGLWAKDRV